MGESFEAQAPNNLIRRVRVEKLFGSFTYDLSLVNEGAYDRPPLTILYGDNGSGKTTVLKLIYNLLSPKLGAGHKSYIAATPFRRLAVELVDGTSITAERRDDLVGS